MPKLAKPAQTEREWWALLKSKDRTIVRSMSDWTALLKDPKRNPLKGCDEKAVAHFTKNLEFRNGGLAHADYSQVVDALSYPEFSRLWGVFGLGMGLFSDHDSYECGSKGTCKYALACICTSNC